jgi:hypothetical protein
MADHEDYLSGEAPMAHGPSHELLGSDQISVAGLSGVTEWQITKIIYQVKLLWLTGRVMNF